VEQIDAPLRRWETIGFRAVSGTMTLCFGIYLVIWNQSKLLGAVFALQGLIAICAAASDRRRKRQFVERGL
jgi:hypothetical protein